MKASALVPLIAIVPATVVLDNYFAKTEAALFHRSLESITKRIMNGRLDQNVQFEGISANIECGPTSKRLLVRSVYDSFDYRIDSSGTHVTIRNESPLGFFTSTITGNLPKGRQAEVTYAQRLMYVTIKPYTEANKNEFQSVQNIFENTKETLNNLSGPLTGVCGKKTNSFQL